MAREAATCHPFNSHANHGPLQRQFCYKSPLQLRNRIAGCGNRSTATPRHCHTGFKSLEPYEDGKICHEQPQDDSRDDLQIQLLGLTTSSTYVDIRSEYSITGKVGSRFDIFAVVTMYRMPVKLSNSTAYALRNCKGPIHLNAPARSMLKLLERGSSDEKSSNPFHGSLFRLTLVVIISMVLSLNCPKTSLTGKLL